SGTLAITGTGITLNGDITTSGTQTYTGAVTLGNSLTTSSIGGASTGNSIAFSSTIIGTLANTQALTLNSGTTGTIAVTGAIGGTSLSTLTITNSGGATFSSSINTGTSIVISESSAATLVSVAGNLTTPTLTVTGSANAYNVRLIGSANTITNAVTFANTGTLILGDAAADTFTFSGGVTATAPSAVTLAGSFTSGGTFSVGDANTGITLADNTSISTAAANAALNLDGAVAGASKTLTLNAGTSTISFGSTATALGNTSLTANEINLAGNFAGTGTLTIIPSTTTRDIYLGSADNSNTSVLNLTATELAYLVDGFSAITIGGGTYSGNINSQAALSFKDPTSFTSSGTFTLAHNLAFVTGTNASFTINGPLTWNAGDITTGSGLISINGNIDLGGSSVKNITTSSGNITIGASSLNTLTGNNLDLVINSGSGSTTINSAINGVGAFTLGSSNQSGAFYILSDLNVGSISTGTTAFDIYFGASPNLLSNIKITADNGYTAYLNGVLLGSGNNWGAAETFSSLGSLVNGLNVLGIYAYDQGGIAALQALLTYSNGTYAGSNVNWKVTSTDPTANTNWNKIGFNDSAWANATIVGPYNTGPWGAVISNSNANWIWASDPNGIDNIWVRFAFSTNSSASTSNLTVNSSANFRNAGVLNFNSSGTANIGGTFTAASQSSVQLMGVINAGGVVTLGAASTPVSLAGDTTISTATANSNAGANIAINGVINGAYALSLNAVGGVINFNKPVGTSAGLSSVTVNNAQTGAVSFSDATTMTAFNSGSGPYNLSFIGATSSISYATTFSNTGTLNLGNLSTDVLTFSAGFTATAPSSVSLAGTITSNGTTSIGDAGTPITLLAATTINTSGGAVSNRNLTLGGAVSGSNQALTLTTGTGVLATAALGSSGNGLGALIISADEFNPTADIYGQSTLVIKPYTSGNSMILGGLDSSNNNSNSVLDLTVSELAFIKPGFTRITFGSATAGAISTVSDLSFSSPVTFDTNGANINLGANLVGIGNTTFIFSDPVAITASAVLINTVNQSLTFNGTLDGNISGVPVLTLSVGSGDITLNGTIGTTYDVEVVRSDSSGYFNINANIDTSRINTGSGGTTIIDAASIVTSSTQTYNNAVLIKRNTSLSSTGDILFSSTINTDATATTPTLTINSGSASTTLNGAVGAVKVLGATAITAGSVVTGAGGTITMGANALAITT
ncbi:hypothetical protein B0G85_2061, partial [Polynucleobacter brandtiae]